MTPPAAPKARVSPARRALGLAALVAVLGGGGYLLVRKFQPQMLDAERANQAELDVLRSAPLAGSAAAPGAGWPQWFGPNRDGRAPAADMAPDWAANPPRKVWEVPGGGGYSSFAVVGGRLYTQDKVGDKERVRCLDAGTGQEVWAHESAADYAGVGYAAGPRATPTVHAGRVYAVGAAGRLACLDAGTGQPVWEHDLKAEFSAPVPQWGFASSPLIEGDLVVVQPGGKGGAVAAFDPATGDKRWAAGADPNGYSSPVAATLAGVRQVVAVTGDSILGVAPADGRVLWRHEWRTQYNGNIATPVVAGDYVFVSSGYAKGCTLLRVVPAGGGAKAEVVYFRKGRVMKTHHSTAVHKDGYLYGYDDDTLRCVDLRTGEVQDDWNAKEVSGGANKGCLILAGQHLLGQTQGGTLFLADADPAEFRLRGKLPGVLSGSDCWALPVLVDGRVYVRDHTKIVCLDARPK